MAFKTGGTNHGPALDPAAHFKTLTKRHYPDVMPHQKEMLESYAAEFVGESDVALQLPTGSGKTLVGLLIADWRRKKFGNRVVFLCPTKQLVCQTVQQAHEKYGIDVVDLSGSKRNFLPAERTAFTTGNKIAVSTYSGLFNTNPFFKDPDLIIVDDAHAAENYIANMWTLEILAGTPLHSNLAEFLRPHIDPQQHSRLTGDWMGTADATWVEKMPTPQVRELESGLTEIIDAHASEQGSDIYFPWSLLRDHLGACHIYLGSRQILIRPLIPPTSTHRPFADATQRIYMSATLGAGGDLERLTGRKSIRRLKAPAGFQSAGVGRRFFVFPSLSLTGDETDNLRLNMQRRAGRSVVLTPSIQQAEQHVESININLTDFSVFKKDDIETDKTPFILSKKAAAIFANRYDGIDFPGDECRLLCVDGLPKAMNIQERFIMSKMGARALYNERIQTRILQATGRCTRALQDRSTVLITGTELVDSLADDRQWKYFHPELQSELAFGVQQSTNTNVADFLENFEMFIDNSDEWANADGLIRNAISNHQQTPFPGMDELEAVVQYEVAYQEAMWNKDYKLALASARSVLGGLKSSELRGYRALWHYLSGSVCQMLSVNDSDEQAIAAMDHFRQAKLAAPSVNWLNSLARAIGVALETDGSPQNAETLYQVEQMAERFVKLGTSTNAKFEKRAASILINLQNPKQFELGLVELGDILGFDAGNDESDAAPDPWWLGEKYGVVFEAHADGLETTIFGANKARQAASHPKWLKQNVPAAKEMALSPILLTPCTKAKSGAAPQLVDVHYWRLEEFVDWASRALGVLRELKGTLSGTGDLVWRAEAAQRLESETLTLHNLTALPIAAEEMEIVD